MCRYIFGFCERDLEEVIQWHECQVDLKIFLYLTKTIKRPPRPGADPVPPLARIIKILPHEHALVMLPAKTLFIRLTLKTSIL